MKLTKPVARTLIIGSVGFVQDLSNEINKRPQCRYQVIGIVVPEEGSKAEFRYPRLGTLEQLHRIIQYHKPDVIIVALARNVTDSLDHQLLEAKVCHKIRIEHGDLVYEQLTGKIHIETLPPGGVIYDDEFKPGRLPMLVARILSFCLSVAGLVLFMPLLLIIAVLIKLTSKGPVFFIQQRMGYAGKCFRLIKFRTMSVSGAINSEWEGDNAHRITRVGKWLRKYRLDELPQFINVIRGEMNIVGPRPHPASNFALFVLVSRNTPECGLQIPYYTLRSNVRPGITGWAQVRYRYANNIDEEMEKLRFDLYYLKHYSIWLDFRIFMLTIKTILVGHELESPVPVIPVSAGKMPRQENKKSLQVGVTSSY